MLKLSKSYDTVMEEKGLRPKRRDRNKIEVKNLNQDKGDVVKAPKGKQAYMLSASTCLNNCLWLKTGLVQKVFPEVGQCGLT